MSLKVISIVYSIILLLFWNTNSQIHAKKALALMTLK